MNVLVDEIRHRRLLWLLAFVPVLPTTAFLVTNSARSARFPGVLVLIVYVVFAMTLYLLPPRAQ